jgi:mannose/cellobiose epimerase-like protein (N-acyl-D-glucosamine 2-epimerase family)
VWAGQLVSRNSQERGGLVRGVPIHATGPHTQNYPVTFIGEDREGIMRELDREWVGSFLDTLLTSWRRHADMPNGLFHPYLDREWRHHTDGPRTLVTQCRVIYNFTRAFERGGDEAYAELARRGLAALEGYFGDAEGGGWAWSCDGEGRVLDDTHDAYGHAFVILATATAAGVLQDMRYRDLALATWGFMQRRFRDEHGGLIWHIARDGRVLDDARSQNPLMHTFEALLALTPLDDSGAVLRDAAAIWRFLAARMPAPGCLPEWYDPAWRPLREGTRALVEVGHLFEWAWLLSEAQPFFPGDDLLGPGRQFLAFGMRHGYDADAGGIFSQITVEGHLSGRPRGWWEQCEALRAMQRYVARHGAAEIAAPLRQSLDFVRRHYVDEEYGGWYTNPPGMGGEPSLAKGTVSKLDYHVVNMCRELLTD